MVVNLELRNYALEIAMYDKPLPDIGGSLFDADTESDTAIHNWMVTSANPALPSWRDKNNAGYVYGLVFDSNLDITVRDSKGDKLDHFKGSDCFDLAYAYKEYSVFPIRVWRQQRVGGRITGMELTKDCVHRYKRTISYASPYSRDKLHFGLTKVKHIVKYNPKGYTENESEVFIVDSNLINQRADITCNGPKYQKVIEAKYAYGPAPSYTEANAQNCDKFYKNFISKGEFK
jgi:hypothetical protein